MPFTISLAITDRPRALGFYRDGLGLEAFGPLADDGVPEPLQLRLGPDVNLMLIPTGGFGWVVGEDRVAPAGTTGCLLSAHASDEDELRERYDAALAAGGTSVQAPRRQEWGTVTAQVLDPDGNLWMIETEVAAERR
jgi:catechol 2,3-dioxygenase-like lactoylglutathione lyase family enzyme